MEESERWVVVHTNYNPQDDSTKILILDKTKCTEKDGHKVLYVNTEAPECVRVYQDRSHQTLTHLLPGSAGAIIVRHDGYYHARVFYDDFAGAEKASRELLCVELDYYNTGREQKLILTYGGMLYFQFNDYHLVPIWADLTETGSVSEDCLIPGVDATKAFGGCREYLTHMLLGKPLKYVGKYSNGIVESADGRWVMHTESAGYTVVDMATKKTYTLRGHVHLVSSSCVFVGVNEQGDQPIFYRVHLERGNTRDTGCYLKYRMDNRRSVIPKPVPHQNIFNE